MIDLSKLAPEPKMQWDGRIHHIPGWTAGCDEDKARFIVLAHRAFVAQTQRSREGWRQYWDGNKFAFHRVPGDVPIPPDVQEMFDWQDPLTAWVEADSWYRFHVEKGGKHVS